MFSLKPSVEEILDHGNFHAVNVGNNNSARATALVDDLAAAEVDGNMTYTTVLKAVEYKIAGLGFLV